MNPKESLELVYTYINNVLADEDYDPHLSTLKHFILLQDLSKEGLGDTPTREETITISCCGDVTGPEGPGACAIVIRFPREKNPAWHSRILPKALNKETAAYDAIYEALLFIGNRPERFRKHEYPIQIQLANNTVVEQIGPTCVDPCKDFRNKWERVTQGLKDYKEIFQREIEVVWRPKEFTEDLKTAMRMVEEELSEFK